jgi:hypothetical protein
VLGGLSPVNQPAFSSTIFKPTGISNPGFSTPSNLLAQTQPGMTAQPQYQLQPESQIQPSCIFSGLGQSTTNVGFPPKLSTNLSQLGNIIPKQNSEGQTGILSSIPGTLSVPIQRMTILNPTVNLTPTNYPSYDKIESFNIQLINII